MPLNQDLEGGLGRFVVAVREPIEKLPVRQPAERSYLEECVE